MQVLSFSAKVKPLFNLCENFAASFYDSAGLLAKECALDLLVDLKLAVNERLVSRK